MAVDQVGGTHYQDCAGQCPHCGGVVKHWDWAAKLPYLVGCCTKYVARFQSKEGFKDLLKGLSYLHKMMETYYPAEWQAHEQQRADKAAGMVRQMDPELAIVRELDRAKGFTLTEQVCKHAIPLTKQCALCRLLEKQQQVNSNQ